MEVFTPTDEQRRVFCDVIEDGTSALVTAGPGTGKSRTAIECATKFIEKKQLAFPYQVLFLSFSNAAVKRLARGAGVHFTREQQRLLRFSTYHALAAEIVSLYGRFVGLPRQVRVIDKLEENLISIERNLPTGKQELLQALLGLAKGEGLLAFDVLIPLTVSLLGNSPTLREIVGRRFPLIVVDEFQDTSQAQWNFLKVLGEGSQVIAFGDPNQIIYASMHDATKKRLDEFQLWKGIPLTPFSSHNYRCGRGDILSFADAILGGHSHSLLQNGNVRVLDAQYRSSLRSMLALIWKTIYDKIGPGKTIGFLTPSNAIAEETANSLRNPPTGSRIPFPVYVRLGRDEAAYDCAVLAIAALRDMVMDCNDLTVKKAAVALLAMKRTWMKKSSPSDSIDKTVKLIEQARAAGGTPLGRFLTSLKDATTIGQSVRPFGGALEATQGWKKVGTRLLAHAGIGAGHCDFEKGQGDLFDTIRESRTPKGLEGDEAFEGKTHVLTYHKAKGREFDFVVIVVDPRGESTHVPLDEKRRLYYVAATRAKEWLGVIHFGRDCGEVLGPVLGIG
ncbi:MAG: ATP-dependent helicase [Candidatus Hydrogenedentales bacterium]